MLLCNALVVAPVLDTQVAGEIFRLCISIKIPNPCYPLVCRRKVEDRSDRKDLQCSLQHVHTWSLLGLPSSFLTILQTMFDSRNLIPPEDVEPRTAPVWTTEYSKPTGSESSIQTMRACFRPLVAAGRRLARRR